MRTTKPPRVARGRTGAAAQRAGFLAAYRELGNLKAAAACARCDRMQHYRWLTDPVYAAQFAEAQQEAVETMEAEARRRAVTGVIEPVYQVGEKVGTIRKFSDVLLIFLLKAARPEVYRDRYDVTARTLSASVDLKSLSDADLRAEFLAVADQLRAQELPALVAAAEPVPEDEPTS